MVSCGIVPPRRSLPAVIVIRLQTPAMEKVLLMTLKSKVKAMMINMIIDYGGGDDRDNQDNAVIRIFLQAPIKEKAKLMALS